MKDNDKIKEIEPFEIGDKSKSRELRVLESSKSGSSKRPKLWDIEFENDEILNFNLYVDYTKLVLYKEGKGNYDPIYTNGEITGFKEVGKDKGSYKEDPYNKKQFFLTLSINCPKCNHNELLVDSIDTIHSTLLDLEENFGDKYLNKDEGSEIIYTFKIKVKFDEEFDEFADLDLKCLKCHRVFPVFLPEENESEVCEKIWEIFS